MKVRDAFLAKGLVPVMNHRNDTYAMIERDARPLVNGLLHRRDAHVFLAIAHSAKSTAVTFLQDDVYLIALTDTLVRRLEEAVIGYLEDPGVAGFIHQISGLEYSCEAGWPAAMTWGTNPDSRRSTITTDVRYALFYEIFDAAWTFAVLHECSHIENGDLEPPTPVSYDPNDLAVAREARLREWEEDPHALTQYARDLVDLMFYGGPGSNKHARLAEVSADRNAVVWLMQLLLRKYVEEPNKSGEPDPYAQFHLVLGAFGAMAAVLLIAPHEIDDESTMPTVDHPSFDGRLAGIGEGIEAVLASPDSPLEAVDAYRTLHVIAELRAPLESVIFGAPSKYTTLI